MTETLVETVARAIHAARFKEGGSDEFPFENEDKSGREYCLRLATAAIAAIRTELLGDAAKLKETLAMSVAQMSRARGRLETIATCNEDRRIANSLGTTCDHIRRVAFPEIEAALSGSDEG